MGASEARRAGDRLLFPLRRYRGDHPPAPPPGVFAGAYHVVVPPYVRWSPVTSLDSLARAAGSERAAILAWNPEELIPNAIAHDVHWLRTALPSLSLVVRLSEDLPADVRSGLATRIGRGGAVPVTDDCDSPRAAARAVIQAFAPEVDLWRWMRHVAPEWPTHSLSLAMADFASGYGFDPENARLVHPRRELPRHQRLWQRMGRALRAALELQKDARALMAIALEAGYADNRSMDRSLVRAFGVSAGEVRGTAGWEWLMWRFVCGLGEGKEKRWDQ